MQFDAQRAGGLPGGLHSGVMGRGKTDDRSLHRKALLLQNTHSYAGIHTAAHAHQNLVLRFKGIKTHSFHHVPPYAWRPPYCLLCSTASRSQRSFSGCPAWPFSQW